MLWILAVPASAQTADFDTQVEGTNGSVIVDGGLTFSDLDNRGLSAPPGNIAIDQADNTLGGLTGFTAVNALGFGGYSAGPDGAFGRFGSMLISNGSVGGSAEVNVFETGGYGGLTLTLDASYGGAPVATDTEPMAAAFGTTSHTLTIEGVTFDRLRLSVGPTGADVAFLLVDHVVVGPVVADSGTTGDTALPETGGSAAPTTSGSGGSGGSGSASEADTDTDVDTDADSDPIPTDSGTADPKGCGCDLGGRPNPWILVALLTGWRRRV